MAIIHSSPILHHPDQVVDQRGDLINVFFRMMDGKVRRLQFVCSLQNTNDHNAHLDHSNNSVTSTDTVFAH